ncbi:conserved hypothetical protein [Candidatus Nitrotoga sp. HW29]|uniref:DUF5681 domain-containing protein n=1 Tax=Candidatus Nitrotoga sp. HW29 TaxID=2886963 RepID=UPI001EF2E514|nr:DUF5681 domain-containing protein [Candidatus Nitrotoga sp. HW29]CAH1903705.1 conserved hypothetical protein [Candidatus Nitrotoga sp. HW29]
MAEQQKSKRGRWKAGESGNPKGRTPGTGKVAKLRDSIAAHLPAIITQLVAKAKEGDSQAARLLLERVLPPMKPIEQPTMLILPNDGSLTAKAAAVLTAAAAGELAPSQAAQIITALGTLAKITEVDELAARITALEVMKNGND